ncbi:unnamed protein product [Cuscuta europaea]|uniref:Uncharacterized protein n=1 Tax=Cuscuta europaea TaxID=41803 RepID=A0A9P0YI22_CUSEU|nr:unnamed protein product [Cuscuta europaea]
MMQVVRNCSAPTQPTPQVRQHVTRHHMGQSPSLVCAAATSPCHCNRRSMPPQPPVCTAAIFITVAGGAAVRCLRCQPPLMSLSPLLPPPLLPFPQPPISESPLALPAPPRS